MEKKLKFSIFWINFISISYLLEEIGSSHFKMYTVLRLRSHKRDIRKSTIDSEGFKGGTRGAPIMPRDAVSRTANVERTGRHKWVHNTQISSSCQRQEYSPTDNLPTKI